MEKRTLFWDVDTQYDFIMPDGGLYVEGADLLIPTISEIRAIALDSGCSIAASTDWHSPDNPEISENPDFHLTFPAHCLAGSPGAQRVGYLGDLPLDTSDLEPRNPAELEKLAAREQFHIVIRKEAISVFSNPNTASLVEFAAPGRIIVFGFTLDFCVRDTLQGLAQFPDVQLVLVQDAAKAVDPDSEGRVLDELQRAGVDMVRFSDLREMAPCG